MKSIEVTITDSEGLHARPASLLCKEAAKYDEDITLSYQNRTVDLKSILGVMSLSVPTGAVVSLNVKGDHADQILNQIVTELKKLKLIN